VINGRQRLYGQASYYDYIGMICIHSYDSIKTGMDILIGSSFAF
jgi:hypothetical protein